MFVPLSEYAYYSAVTVPAGSTYISVSEATPSSSNYLSLQGLQTGDSLNRYFKVLPTGTRERPLAGSLWHYQRQHGNGMEVVRTDGPIDEDVTIYILANQIYDGIRFTFNVPNKDLDDLERHVYTWNTTEWGVCDVGCGSGYQERGVACLEVYRGGSTEEVDDTECGFVDRPISRQECGMEPCEYQWVVSEWDSCNVSCGVGVMVRTVRCESGDVGGVAEEHLCPEERRPYPTQQCQQEACQYQWQHGEWEACDAVCGEGWEEREVWCEMEGRPGDVVNEGLCEGNDKPDEKGTCHAPQPCSNFQWSVSTWSEVRG